MLTNLKFIKYLFTDLNFFEFFIFIIFLEILIDIQYFINDNTLT